MRANCHKHNVLYEIGYKTNGHGIAQRKRKLHKVVINIVDIVTYMATIDDNKHRIKIDENKSLTLVYDT